MSAIKEIEHLQGEPLSDVCFVTDYVQLGFSGALLACFSEPVIETSTLKCRFPESGSRDALCSFISHAPTKILVQDGVAIILEFSVGKITVPLDAQNQKFGEAASFTPGLNKPVQIF